MLLLLRHSTRCGCISLLQSFASTKLRRGCLTTPRGYCLSGIWAFHRCRSARLGWIVDNSTKSRYCPGHEVYHAGAVREVLPPDLARRRDRADHRAPVPSGLREGSRLDRRRARHAVRVLLGSRRRELRALRWSFSYGGAWSGSSGEPHERVSAVP